jgi:hypothetical protein
MQIVGALDVHRSQITFKTVDLASGEVWRGRISPATREAVRVWLDRFAGLDAEFALEGTTGWRFVVEDRTHSPAPQPALQLRAWRNAARRRRALVVPRRGRRECR